MKDKPRLVIITESNRRDTQAPLRFFKDLEVVHFYLKAPYGDMSEADLKKCRQVDINNLVDEIVKAKPQIIQGVEPFGSRLGLKLSFLSLKAKNKTGAKLVCPVLENRPIKERFSLLQRAVLRAFCPKFFAACDAVVALNKGAVQNIRYYFGEAKIVTGIVWGVWGVNTESFKPSAPKQKNLCIYVGRLIEEKGLMYLLEGFKEAYKNKSDLRLSVIGQGPLQETMQKFVKENGLDKAVSFEGVIKNENLPAYFSRAELCIYPSIATPRWEEQVGTVNFQALACSTPVLTTKSGAIPEYIKEGEGAILIEPENSQAITNALLKFFTDDKFKREVTEKARPYAKQFDVRGEIAKAEKLMLKIIRAKSDK